MFVTAASRGSPLDWPEECKYGKIMHYLWYPHWVSLRGYLDGRNAAESLSRSFAPHFGTLPSSQPTECANMHKQCNEVGLLAKQYPSL